jgi:hypothetical protein
MVLRPGSRIRVGNAEIEIDIDRDALFRLDGDAQAYRGLVLCSRNTSPPAREARSFLAE